MLLIRTDWPARDKSKPTWWTINEAVPSGFDIGDIDILSEMFRWVGADIIGSIDTSDTAKAATKGVKRKITVGAVGKGKKRRTSVSIGAVMLKDIPVSDLDDLEMQGI